MKKILLLMAIILPFVLTSCDDDKDEPKQSLEEQLIGGWAWSTVDGPNTITRFYIFNSDHNGKEQIDLNGHISTEVNFTWSLKGNILTVSFIQDGNTETVSVEISIDGDVLHIKQGDDTIDYHRAKG
ncbi:MAG: lipocalin family protein [Muribaculaceae bacterium]|nr:lipocalin family protein [Muribaculaceae bacterium]